MIEVFKQGVGPLVCLSRQFIMGGGQDRYAG